MLLTKVLKTHNGCYQNFTVKYENGEIYYTSRSGKYNKLKNINQIKGERKKLVLSFMKSNNIKLTV